MAELLNGNSSTSAHAPLSQEQTLALCTHLKSMIDETSRQINELRVGLRSAEGQIDIVRGDGHVQRSAHEALKSDVADMSFTLQALKKETTHNTSQSKALQEVLNQATESIDKLRSGQETTNTNVHNLREDVLKHTSDIRKVWREIEEIQGKTTTTLSARVDRLEVASGTLMEDAEHAKASIKEHNSRVVQLEGSVKTLSGDVNNLGGIAKKITTSVSELTVRLDGVQENLELTNAVVMRIHNDHESTKSDSSGLKEELRSLTGAHQALKGDHASTQTSLRSAQDDLGNLKSSHSQVRDNGVKTNGDVKGLQQDQQNTSKAVQNLTKHLQRLHMMASATQDDLRKTNSFVLPNLGAEGTVSPAHLKAALTSSDFKITKAATQPPTPRTKRDASWHSRNIGAVPDRMSYI